MAGFAERFAKRIASLKKENKIISVMINGKLVQLEKLINGFDDDVSFNDDDFTFDGKRRKEEAEKKEKRPVDPSLDRENDNELTEEEKKKRKEKESVVAAMVEKLEAIKLEGEKSDLPGDRNAAKAADDMLKDPEFLKELSRREMEAAVEEVNKKRLAPEDEMTAELGKEADENLPEMPLLPDEPENDGLLVNAKKDLTEYAARMLALKTMARTIKSYAVADKSLSEAEIKDMSDQMLNEKSIAACAADIKGRDDFRRMMNKVESWDDFKTMRQEIVEGGNKLFDRLAKTSRQMIKDDTERLTAEEVQAEADAMQRQQGRNMVLERNTNPFFDD